MAEALPVERLRAYLQELKPEARAMLLAELERSLARGGEVPGGALLLEELRRTVRVAPAASPPEAPRIATPARLFFAPLEPFLVDHDEAPPSGRIARAAIDPLWQWISRDLVPGDAKAYGDELERSLADEKTVARLVRAFQDLVVNRIQEALAAIKDEHARRRFAAQVGTPRALDDLGAVLGVLKARDALALIASRLPSHIRNIGDEQLENVKTLLDSPIARHPDIFVYALVVVMKRLTAPWQLVRLAVKAADSDKAQRIKETPYAAAVTVVLGEIACAVAEFRHALRRGEIAAVGGVLKDIHDAVRLLRTEMDLAGDSPWARELAALRAAVSALVKGEIETVPGRVRRLLRPRAVKDVIPGSALDATDVAETEALIEFVNTCRNYASELATNEVTLRVHSELENFLDTGTPLLLESLRAAGSSDRAFRVSQVEAAVRFAGKVFGPSYATLLAKAAEVAQNGERKAAKA